MTMSVLEQRISELHANPPQGAYLPEHFETFEEFNKSLNAGEVRAATPESGSWRVNGWVKQGILLEDMLR